MSMRVTSGSMFVTFKDGLSQSLARVQTYQSQLASGRRINTYSDDPVGSVMALRARSEETQWTSYQKAASDAQSWLGTADSTMQTMSAIMRRISDLTISSANGTLSVDARKAIADEISQLRDQLQDLSNTKHLGRPIFGGYADRAVAATTTSGTTTWTYEGDDGQVLRQISPSTQVQVNVDGKALFGFDGAAGTDLFSDLDKTIDAIKTNNTTVLTAQQTALDGHLQSILSGLGSVGARVNRVTAASDLGSSTVLTLKSQRSGIEDANLAESVLMLQQAQSSYQAALGAVGRANLPSLAEFLR